MSNVRNGVVASNVRNGVVVRDVLAGEWIKFATLRSTWWTLAMVAALPVGVALLVAVTGSLAPEDTVLAGALGNAVVGLVPAGILGALIVAGEYSGGTIRLTLAAVPVRWPVVLAKAMLAGALVFPVALAAYALGFALAAALLPDHRPGAPVPALLGVALVYVFVAVLGVALGTAIRSPAGAVTAVTAVLLAPAFLAPLLTRLAPGRRGSPGAADEPGGGSRVSGSADNRLSGTTAQRDGVASSDSWPGHQSCGGTCARTSSTCSPHPAHVVLPQTWQGTGRHMVAPPRRVVPRHVVPDRAVRPGREGTRPTTRPREILEV